MKFDRSLLSTAAAAATLVAVALVPAQAQATNGYVTVYFTRHAEKMTDTTVVGDATAAYEADYNGGDTPNLTITGEASTGDNLNEICGTSKCAEVLNPLGELRAELLADFLERWGVTRRLDAVYSSHKVRTRQTVEPTAERAGTMVVQLPTDGTELEPESTTPSECPTIDAIQSAQPGETLLVAGHSGTLYDIMGDGNDDCDGLGLDTSNDNRFPKDEDGKVRDFGDLWKVVIRNGQARFVYRVNLQPKYLFIENKAF